MVKIIDNPQPALVSLPNHPRGERPTAARTAPAGMNNSSNAARGAAKNNATASSHGASITAASTT